ncbi:hypothetical protein LUZ60_009668 [Juncus effusus]|nr:hypothetical protein LUZ60_009668 [Juncus effusus]
MASSAVFSFKPTVSVRTHATASNGYGSGSGSKPGSARSGNWWTPIFGWSSQPEYMNSSSASAESHQAPEPAQRRYGVFTEEKARELRKRMLETESYHDAMYHSAIASRLASDFSRKKGSSA